MSYEKKQVSSAIFVRETLLPLNNFAKFVIFSKFNVQRSPYVTSDSTFSHMTGTLEISWHTYNNSFPTLNFLIFEQDKKAKPLINFK